MIYIIQGQEPFFIREKIDEIVKESKGDVFRFDGSDKDFSINEMLESCMGNSLFSSSSVILVDQPYFLIRKCDDDELSDLIDYIDNPVFETELIFYTYNDNFNSRLKAYKSISSNARVLNLNSYDYKNFNAYVKAKISEAELDITNDAVFLLNNICKRNATLFNRNLEILKLYPEKITPEVINKLCTASDENDSFDMVNALTNRDISKTISIERKLLSENDSALSVIGLLAGQLRFLYQIAYYQSIGKKKNEIIEICNINEYRYNKAQETLKNLKMNQIIELLNKLSEIDIACKSDNSIPDSSRFELFILDLLKKGNYAGN